MDNQNAKIINMQNSQGKTALHFACSEGHDYTAETLLKLGAVIERYVKTPYLLELSNLIADAGYYLTVFCRKFETLKVFMIVHLP